MKKFTHLMWCKNLYCHRRSFRVAAFNIWWVSTLWNYPSKALSTICRQHASSIRVRTYVCIHLRSIRVCVQPFVYHACTVSETCECSITRNGTHICTCMWTSQYTCASVKLYLSSTIITLYHKKISPGNQLSFQNHLKSLKVTTCMVSLHYKWWLYLVRWYT